MAFSTGTTRKQAITRDGIPYLWNSVDLSTYQPTLISKIKPSDGSANGWFGTQVRVADGRIVVGASLDSRVATYAGSVYVFDMDGTQIAKITSRRGSVANAFYGNYFAVGCGRIAIQDRTANSNAGSLEIYDLNGNWIATKAIADITYSNYTTAIYFPQEIGFADGRLFVHVSGFNSAGDTDISTTGTIAGATYTCNLSGVRQGTKGTVSTEWLATTGQTTTTGAFMSVGDGIILQRDYTITSQGRAGCGIVYVLDYTGRCIGRINHPGPTANYAYFGSGGGYNAGRIIGSGRIVLASNQPAAQYIFSIDGTLIATLTAASYPGINGSVVYIADGKIYFMSSTASRVFSLDGEFIGNMSLALNTTAAGVGEGRVVVANAGDTDNGTNSGAMWIYKYTPTLATPFDLISSNSFGA